MLDAGIPIETPADRRKNIGRPPGPAADALDRSPCYPWRASRDHSPVVQPLLHAASDPRGGARKLSNAIDRQSMRFTSISRTRALALPICRTIWSPRFYIRSSSCGCSAVHANSRYSKQSAEPVAIRCEEAALRRVSRGRPASRAVPHPKARSRKELDTLGGAGCAPRPRGEGPGTTLVASPALRRVFTAERIGSILQILWSDVNLQTGWLFCRAETRKFARPTRQLGAARSDRILACDHRAGAEAHFRMAHDGSSLYLHYKRILRRAGLSTHRKRSSICSEGPRPAISKPLAATHKATLGILP